MTQAPKDRRRKNDRHREIQTKRKREVTHTVAVHPCSGMAAVETPYQD